MPEALQFASSLGAGFAHDARWTSTSPGKRYGGGLGWPHRLLVLLLMALLGGCYTSKADLIGSRAAQVLAFDALIPIGEDIFYARQLGQTVDFCRARRRQDLARECADLHQVKMERLPSGSTLLQVSWEGENGFGLVVPSASGSERQCVEWLGVGILEDRSSDEGAPDFVRGPEFRIFRAMMRAAMPEASLPDRPALLATVSQYENAARVYGPEAGCFGTHIVIEAGSVLLR